MPSNNQLIELIEIQARTLFTHDPHNRIVTINEPDGDIAPRFFLGRTMAGPICRFRHDVPLDIVTELAGWVAREPIQQDLHEPPQYLETYQKILASHAPTHVAQRGPAYFFPEVIAPPVGIVTTRITRANAHL